MCDKGGYEYGILRRYMRLFPNTPLSRLVRAYFVYSDIPIRDREDEDEEKGKQPPRDPEEEREEALADLLVGHPRLSNAPIILRGTLG
jgi:superkiller protein 3